MEPLALTINQTCQTGNWGKTTTYKLIKQGKLQRVKIGRRSLITVASIKALLRPDADEVTNPRAVDEATDTFTADEITDASAIENGSASSVDK